MERGSNLNGREERKDSPPVLNFTGERGEDIRTDCVDRGSHIMYTHYWQL